MKLSISKTAAIELEQLPDIGGNTRHGRQLNVQVGEDSARLSELINHAAHIHFQMPEADRMSEGGRAAKAAVDKFRPAIFRERDSQLLRMVYRELAIRFADKVAARTRQRILDKFGLDIRRRSRFDRALHIVADPSHKVVAEQVVELSNELMVLDEVAIASPNFVSEFVRAAPPTPNAAQWHLRFRPGGGQQPGSDVDIRGAWRTTTGAPNVVVAVLDDGVDVDHVNLRDSILTRPDPNDPRDLVGRDFYIPDDDHPEHFNPRPKRFQYPFDRMTGNDIHGTPCAGVVAAGGRIDKIFGAAPNAKILPVKVFHADDLASEDRIADAIIYAARFADILSCSWSGPRSPIIEMALRDAAAGDPAHRRGRLGAPIFFAAGNDGRRSVSYPAASDHAICVGATTDQADIAGYSNQGDEMWISAPSSGGTRGITTTDVSYANRGFNVGVASAGGRDGLHTSDFGGTSSATPLAAGIAALMLSTAPHLDLDAVKEILKTTAEKIGPPNSYRGNPGYSPAFGYGRIDAAAAVEAARAAP